MPDPTLNGIYSCANCVSCEEEHYCLDCVKRTLADRDARMHLAEDLLADILEGWRDTYVPEGSPLHRALLQARDDFEGKSPYYGGGDVAEEEPIP